MTFSFFKDCEDRNIIRYRKWIFKFSGQMKKKAANLRLTAFSVLIGEIS